MCPSSGELIVSVRHLVSIYKEGKFIIEYIQYISDIISIHPYNNVRIYCRIYVYICVYIYIYIYTASDK
jgi:hypothetical protein